MPCFVHLAEVPERGRQPRPLLVHESYEVVRALITSGFEGQVRLTDDEVRTRLPPISARHILAVQPIPPVKGT